MLWHNEVCLSNGEIISTLVKLQTNWFWRVTVQGWTCRSKFFSLYSNSDSSCDYITVEDTLGPLTTSTASTNPTNVHALADGSMRFVWFNYLELDDKLYFKLKDKTSGLRLSCSEVLSEISLSYQGKDESSRMKTEIFTKLTWYRSQKTFAKTSTWSESKWRSRLAGLSLSGGITLSGKRMYQEERANGWRWFMGFMVSPRLLRIDISNVFDRAHRSYERL